MSRQNRVTPFGEIIAHEARGTLMGNRGCLHDATDRPLRQYKTKAWLICKLEFKNRHRTIMAPREYTELFFLDEATALTAGHRPCAECNRPLFRNFAMHWDAANPQVANGAPITTGIIDTQLHHERLTDAHYQRDKRKRVYHEVIDALPDGCFITYGADTTAYLIYQEQLFPWSAAGYGTPIKRPKGVEVAVLTPQSTVRALAHGYVPMVHPTAQLP
jgi:hypothetical protein